MWQPDPLHARSQLRSLFACPFTFTFQGLSLAPIRRQRQICVAQIKKKLSDKDSFPGGVLTHPGVLPIASCIQLTDLQLSQVQVISLWYPPFTPQGLGMSTGHKKHEFHGTILHNCPWCQMCQMGSKLARVCLHSGGRVDGTNSHVVPCTMPSERYLVAPST